MKGNLKMLLLAATAGAMMMGTAMAQAPAGAPPGAGMGAGGPRGGAPLDRAGVIQRYGLGEASLNLTAAQKAEIDKAADAFVKESAAITATPGQPPSAEATAARTKARDNLTAAVHKVLNEEQRKTWDAAQAARRGGPGGPGGMGGPGGPGGPGAGGPGRGGPGAGGPGGARPPGQ